MKQRTNVSILKEMESKVICCKSDNEGFEHLGIGMATVKEQSQFSMTDCKEVRGSANT